MGGDISKIFRTFKKDDKARDVARLELGSYAKNRGVVASGTVKMEKLHLILTGEHLNKELQTSDWNKRNLDLEQIEYAALDAIISLQLYHPTKGMINISARHSEDTASVRLSIDVVPRFGDRTVIAHTAAEGHILSLNDHWITPDGIHPHILNNTKKGIDTCDTSDVTKLCNTMSQARR
jgi:hypothetical protein